MPQDPRSPHAGFQTDPVPLDACLGRGRAIEFQLCDATTLVPYDPRQSFYWPAGGDPRPLPDPARRQRVHGSEEPGGFILNGYSAWRKLAGVVERRRSRGLGDARWLDWGCGCGRVLRHAPDEVLARLTGLDVDTDALAWCRAAFGLSRFEPAGLVPPTRLPAASFDVVIGVSVMTHLREEVQMLWLRELARLARPGALVLLTIHGPAAAARAGLSREKCREWQERGFHVGGSNPGLAGVLADDSYYVDVFHTHDYVRRRWGKVFRVAEIIPAFISNHQDLVVLERT